MRVDDGLGQSKSLLRYYPDLDEVEATFDSDRRLFIVEDHQTFFALEADTMSGHQTSAAIVLWLDCEVKDSVDAPWLVRLAVLLSSFGQWQLTIVDLSRSIESGSLVIEIFDDLLELIFVSHCLGKGVPIPGAEIELDQLHTLTQCDR